MKTLYESIKHNIGIGRYAIGNRIIEDGVPCTVFGELDGYVCLLSDPVNIGTKNDFYDVSGLEGGDEKYKEVLNSDNLFPTEKEKRPVEIYLFREDVKDYIKTELKKYEGWKIPSLEVLEKLNAYKNLDVHYENISATTDSWCYYNETNQSLKDLCIFSFRKNKEKWVSNIKNAQEPLRLFKIVKL